MARHGDHDFSFHGFANPPAVGRGGTLPEVSIPDTTSQVVGVDLTHVIFTDDVAHGRQIGAAKGGNGGGGNGGGGGGGGGGTTFAPYVSGPADSASGFNITVVFEGSWTQELYDIFVAAADFYTSLIVGELQDVSVRSRGKTTTVDDITINASLTNIDGAGGVLGQAGPTAVRTSNSLPATAIMQFDIADATEFNTLGLFDDIVFHEMGHALGFGSIWGRLGLVDGNGLFTGDMAQGESLALYGTSNVYVEQDGGSGTADAHWDEATYDNEIMTGYINDANYLSSMSAASYGDLGYQLAANYHDVAAGFDLMA